MSKQFERILGCLLGAATGDAMGAATESKTPQMIQERFGGYVEDLLPGPDDTFVRGCEAGQITDDFSLAYFTAVELVRCKGNVDDKTAAAALVNWSRHPEFFKYAGPTTEAAIRRLQEEEMQEQLYFLACDNWKATNGSAMKIAPVGLINPGNLDQTIKDTITICKPTHYNNAALAGAAAVACAVSSAAAGADLSGILEAAFYGVRQANAYGLKHANIVSVPSVERRMEMAIEIGRAGRSWEETMLELGSVIGGGIAIVESVPSVFGIITACGEDTMAGIRMGVNMGNDTDTVATMVGAILGAKNGLAGIPSHYLEMINRVNKIDIEQLAKDIEHVYY